MSRQHAPHPNSRDLGYLYIVQYQQLPGVDSAMHWGLYVAFTGQGTNGPGTLHHWNYSSNEAVTNAVIGCQGCLKVPNKYEKGYLMDTKSKGTRCKKATRVSQYRVITSEDLKRHCNEVVIGMKYSWNNENCQHFVQYSLKAIRDGGFITPDEYSTAMREIIPSRFVSNHHGYATASSSRSEAAPAPRAPSGSKSNESRHSSSGRKHHRSGHGDKHARP